MADEVDMRSGYTAGQCHLCDAFYEWRTTSKARLRDARCAVCRAPLARTAPRLIKREVAWRSDMVFEVPAKPAAKVKPGETKRRLAVLGGVLARDPELRAVLGSKPARPKGAKLRAALAARAAAKVEASKPLDPETVAGVQALNERLNSWAFGVTRTRSKR